MPLLITVSDYSTDHTVRILIKRKQIK